MATPSGTITLNKDYVLLSSTSSNNLTLSGKATAFGQIIQKGANVTDWANNDKVIFDNTYSETFKEGNNAYTLIHQQYIFCKYVAPSS